MKILKSSMLSLMLVALSMFGLQAVAKTPDGQTPAEETVCDVLEGNMFGICNAYCEAMDCDNPNHKASEKACDNKFTKWAELAGENPIPCNAEPEVSLSKTVNSNEKGEIFEGTPVVYTFDVMNIGNVPLVITELSDNSIPDALFDCTAALDGQTLAVNGSISCDSDLDEILADLESVENNATVSAVSIYGALVSATGMAMYTGVPEELAVISLAKTVNSDENGEISEGAPVVYKFQISNDGNVPLMGLELLDDSIPDALDDCTAALDGQTLGVNGSISCDTDADEISADLGEVPNTATVTGMSSYGTPVEATDMAIYTGVIDEPVVACPCWNTAEFDAVVWSSNNVDVCERITWPHYQSSFIKHHDISNVAGTHRLVQVLQYPQFDPPEAYCYYRDYAQTPKLDRFLELTPDEGRACDGQVRQAMIDTSRICSDIN